VRSTAIIQAFTGEWNMAELQAAFAEVSPMG
jgi:hypothetical protein